MYTYLLILFGALVAFISVKFSHLRRFIMATADELKAAITEFRDFVVQKFQEDAADDASALAQLQAIADKVNQLQAGGNSQALIDELSALVSNAKNDAAAAAQGAKDSSTAITTKAQEIIDDNEA